MLEAASIGEDSRRSSRLSGLEVKEKEANGRV